MLPQIELLSPETGPIAEYSPPTPKQIIDSAESAAIFADLVRARILTDRVDIELPEGQSLPDNGNALPLPAPVSAPDQRIVPPQPARKPGPPVETVPLRRRGVPRITFPQITHEAQVSAHRQGGLARGPGLVVRSDEGLREWQLRTHATSTKPATAASADTPVGRFPLKNADTPVRPLTGLSQFVAVPDTVVSPPSATPQLPGQHAQYTDATAEFVPSPTTKKDTVLPPDPRLEALELKTPTDGHKRSVQLTTTAPPSATASGNIVAATTSPLVMPATATVASMVGASAPQVVGEIDIPVLGAEWGTALNERVTWMANSNIQNAEIRMNPAELGPVRVQVSINEGAAQVVFDVQHALTREAIELALPRLREMLSDNDLLLTEVSVSDQEVHHDQPEVERDSTSEIASAEASLADGEDQSGAADVHTRVKSGLVDSFV